MDWRPKNLWGRQGLASVVLLVSFVLQRRMLLGAVITPVEPSGGPIKAELILCGAEMQPIKPHVHRFGLTRQNGVIVTPAAKELSV